ncbi:hypothetical protein LOK49_LG01G00038 [Camellia lanceoleosa]|uniref:Uncharacterized protein n=1 Tax=Camellia lanceoleosa TaxID=1840588 RepID=A0ACC0IZJ3_9ERIC|nr:hypothetical protein LOK49_LG01G00038 [Camellia lanceoleosa]
MITLKPGLSFSVLENQSVLRSCGDQEIVAYGHTKINCKYQNGYDYTKYGAKACKAKLHMAPKDSIIVKGLYKKQAHKSII